MGAKTAGRLDRLSLGVAWSRYDKQPSRITRQLFRGGDRKHGIKDGDVVVLAQPAAERLVCFGKCTLGIRRCCLLRGTHGRLDRWFCLGIAAGNFSFESIAIL